MTHKQMATDMIEAVGLSEPPIGIYYAETKPDGAFCWAGTGEHFCFVGRLAAVRAGTPMAVDGANSGCGGSAQFLGWTRNMRPGFEYFLSHDDQGGGERFKKTPELARTFMESNRPEPANGRYCIFQRLADVPEEIAPEVVAIFADAEEIGALVSLANYGRPGKDAVISPFTSGCGSLVGEPRVQALQAEPKAVLGLFDPTVRPRMDKDYLSFSTPYRMFVEMVENIPGSFLEIEPWLKVRDR